MIERRVPAWLLQVFVRDPHSLTHSQTRVPSHEPFPRRTRLPVPPSHLPSGSCPIAAPTSRGDQPSLAAMHPPFVRKSTPGQPIRRIWTGMQHFTASREGEGVALRSLASATVQCCHEERTELATPNPFGDVGRCKVNPLARVSRQSAPSHPEGASSQHHGGG